LAATVVAGGCATPGVVPWEAPAPWKPNQTLSPQTAQPPVTPPAAPTPQPAATLQFASDVANPAAATAPVSPEATKPTAIAPAPVASPIAAQPVEGSGLESEPAKETSYPNIRLRGRIEPEMITVSQSQKSKELFGDFQNAVGFRRARLGAEGEASEMSRWVFEVDFAGGNVNLKDAFFAVNHLPLVREVRVGYIAEPFTLEGQTRSVWFPFTERSSSFVFDPTRRWGAAFYSYTDDQRLFVQGGAFKSGTTSDGNDVGDSNDMAYVARLVALPWFDDSNDSMHLLHVGGAISQVYPKDNKVTFNQGPQNNLLQSGSDNPRIDFVPTVSMTADQYQLFNLQAALVLGPLSFQAEWTGTHVDQTNGQPVNLGGWYVFGSYFLTGEHRAYNRQFGTFWEPTVRQPFLCKDGRSLAGGPGAWEVAVRLAYLNFDSSNLPKLSTGLPSGTRQTTVTVGLNWYLNDNARIMFDWTHALVDYPPFGDSTADSINVRTAVFW
jgi:phosphate-selective porin OprO/OprP